VWGWRGEERRRLRLRWEKVAEGQGEKEGRRERGIEEIEGIKDCGIRECRKKKYGGGGLKE
jgi:hypothetical protein